MKSCNVEDIIGFHLVTEPHGCFSNWYPSQFTYAGVQYNCVEQYMMAQKVAMGHRYDLYALIMETNDPARIKSIAGKDSFPEYASIASAWERNRGHIVKRGLKAKFQQNPEMLQELFDTGDALLCECAAHDKIWGIGINLQDQAWKDVTNWKGDNNLGIALMTVREELHRELLETGKVQYIDYRDTCEIAEWSASAAHLKRIPQYYPAIHAYADQLPVGNVRNAFYGAQLSAVELSMRINMGGGLPVAGFYEMKQEIYEIARTVRRVSFDDEIKEKEK